MKTNAARMLEELGISHELREYPVHSDDLSAETVAREVGVPAEQVFKTLVVNGDREGVCLAVIPANTDLDLKALAKLSGNRRVEMAPLKDVLPLTGYVRGGVTSLAGRKVYPVFVDETILLFDTISVSAGIRGTQILLAPADYIRVTNAVSGAIASARRKKR